MPVCFLQRHDLADDAIEFGEAAAAEARGRSQRADVTSGDVATEFGESAHVLGHSVGQHEGVVVHRRPAFEHTIEGQFKALVKIARKQRRRKHHGQAKDRTGGAAGQIHTALRVKSRTRNHKPN